MRWLGVVLALLATAPLVAFAVAEFDRQRDAADIDRAFGAEAVVSVGDLETVRQLEIVPLVNWHADDPSLRTEAGVSYLIRADELTVLFDLGLNARGEDPSPLLANMRTLGIAPGDIDAVFLSHAHLDHVGGKRLADEGSFALTADQRGLAGLPVFAPVPLSHPTASVQIVTAPQRIMPGVGSTGPIARSLFVGRIEEQALVVNVEGLGIVAVVGCGHQTVPRLLTRIDAAFEPPLFGVVGDLHYPVPEGRLRMLGIDVQRRLASGEGPLAPINADDVTTELALLSDRLGLLALGGHDTSDAVLTEAAGLFGERYRRVVVGEPIVIEASGTPSPASGRPSP